MSKSSFEERQKFIDEITSGRKKPNSESLKILTWNIRNPSLRRAIKQIDWLEKSDFAIIVLTEAKLSQGCIYIRDRLKGFGYFAIFPKPEKEDYGIILASNKFFKEILDIPINFLPYRTSSVVCNFNGNDILVTGVYAPVWKNVEKAKFLEEFEKLISNRNLKKKFNQWIILGDLNVLESNHMPSYPQYKDWEYFYERLKNHGFVDAFRFFHPNEKEYSWFGREGNGYRFDHIFVSENLLPLLKNCFYIHEPRIKKLSDHSAMCLEIKFRMDSPIQD